MGILSPSKIVSKGSLPKKNWIFSDNLLISIATYPPVPNYDINTYCKTVIIEAPTHLQVIMTNIKINFISSSFIFIIFNGKMDKQAL